MQRVMGKEVESERTSGEQPVLGFREPTVHLDAAPNMTMHKELVLTMHES